MVDKARIRIIMMSFEHYWNKHPEWRFGQLVANCIRAKTGARNCDPYYIEDDTLMDGLRILNAMDEVWNDKE